MLAAGSGRVFRIRIRSELASKPHIQPAAASSYAALLAHSLCSTVQTMPRDIAVVLQVAEAMTAIKAAMVWDEAAFGREYDQVRHSDRHGSTVCLLPHHAPVIPSVQTAQYQLQAALRMPGSHMASSCICPAHTAFTQPCTAAGC